MSGLGRPDLYIDGQKMQSSPAGNRPVLAPLKIDWGTEPRFDFDPASTLSGQLLIKGSMPSYLDVGAHVGLVDPVTSRCLFACALQPLTAVNDESFAGARRLSFTAASPIAELEKHNVIDFDWPHEETAAARRGRLARSLPDDWELGGAEGWTWINQGRQLGQSVRWLTLAERYARSYLQRYHDTSTYTPGAGLQKRLTFARERPKAAADTTLLNLPAAAVAMPITWRKTPADVVTDVQIVSYGGAFPTGDESQAFEYLMSYYVNNRALQRRYGMHQRRLEWAASSYNSGALKSAIEQVVNYWLDVQTQWRPTALQIPDSRRLPAESLLRLLAVDTRPTASIRVTDTPEGLPGPILSHVRAGSATWTGTKWDTTLTLGRTLDK